MAPIAVYNSTTTTLSEDMEPTPIQTMSHGPTIPGLPSFKSLGEKRQWQLEHMAGAFRVFARHGYTEGMSGHISVRDPVETDAFWMNPLGVHFGMLKASDMILVQLNGVIVRGCRNRPVNAAGFRIHAAIHKARPDVHAICHTHSTFGRAWSTFARPLEMINQDVCNFYNAQGVYAEYGGLAFGEEEGRRIAQALGSAGKGLTLMNHGLLTVGNTVDEAAYLFRLMEKSCEAQLLAEAAAANGLQKQIIKDEEAAYNFKMASEAVGILDVKDTMNRFLTICRRAYIANSSPNMSMNCSSLEARSEPELEDFSPGSDITDINTPIIAQHERLLNIDLKAILRWMCLTRYPSLTPSHHSSTSAQN